MLEEPIRFSPEIETIQEPDTRSLSRRFLPISFAILILIVLFTGANYFYIKHLNLPTDNFPVGKPITIEQGTGVKAITEILQEDGVVKSKSLLYYTLILFHEPTSVKASTYIFEKPLSTYEIAKRLTEGDFDADLVRFTHFEGERVSLLAKRASVVFPNFNVDSFVATATAYEGKLFPDTYFIPADFTDEELFTLMLETFDEKLAGLKEKISKHELSLDEIIVLASIVEREADSPESKRMVSSVLQNRLEIGMPLQADASIEYILDNPLKELTPEDLKIDSPYNTYLNTGLPPTPIGNPGLEAIEAVLEPTESEYFYYITDDNGDFYFAKNYDQHLLNIKQYLRK